MNGVAAQSMRDKGLVYHMNWGVALPSLKAMAGEYGKDRGLAVALWKNFFRHPLGKITLTLLLAGAVGNLIDRALQGYVVDMFHVLFMEFAVFNVADICVVVGGFAAVIYYLFFYEKLEGKSKDTGAPKEEQA